jgi:CHAT domain-containing protein/Tfp pilus assembly protein PilF
MNTEMGKYPRAIIAILVAAIVMAGSLMAQDASIDEALAQAKVIYSQQGPRAALPEYEKVLAGYRNAGNRHGEAITLGLLGNCYKRLGDYPKALGLLNSALTLKRELHDRPEEGKTLSHLGLVYWEQGEYPKAIEAFEQSIAIARELKDVKLEAASLNNLSLVYDEQGDYRRSLDQYQHALELHRSVNYEPGESDTLGNIGGVYLSLGRYSEAERYYREALAISRRLKLRPSETQDLGNLAQCLLGEGKIQEAIETFDKAIAIAHDAGMTKEEADWYRGRASALLRLGKFDAALTNYESARETYAKGGLKRELTEALSDAGYAYLALGDRLGAEKKFQQAITVSRAIDYERGIVINQLALAEVLRDAREYTRASKNAETALADARKLDDSAEIVGSLLLIAGILRDQHHPRAAYETAEQARERSHRDGLSLLEAESLDRCGELQLKLRQPQEALSMLDAATTIATESGDVDVLWRAEYHRGQSLEALNRDEDAIAAYKASIVAIENVRAEIREQRFRTGYLQDKQQVYMALVRLLLKLGRPAEAFTFSERLREYSYLNLRNGPFTIAATPKMAEAEARIRQLQDRIESESGRPVAQQRSQALRIYSEELVAAQRDYSALIDSSRPGIVLEAIRAADPTEISRALPQETALLEYVVDKHQLTVFVLTDSGLHSVTTRIPEEDLFAKVQLLRELVTEHTSESWVKSAESLRSILITPLARQGLLKGVHSLIVVPQGTLNYLPFAILPSIQSGRLRFLVEDYDISVLPAAVLVLSTQRIPDESTTRLLAFAPSSSGLNFAMEEAKNVAKIFAPDAEVVVGRNATETRFKNSAGQYQVVHLATHAFFNRTNPSFSGLQLEADAENDGRLEVYEILQLNLKARLVTLSACDTALGSGDFAEMPAGDEFVALDRAFLEAGSDAVLASLWKVNDRSTLIIMEHLYRMGLNNNGARALAQAQRAMIRDPRYRQPFYWAPFIFVGKDFGSLQKVAERR